MVLCHHAVSRTWPAALSVTPERLEQQLESLVRRGYRGCTFSEALSQPPGPRTLVVTFDDAYRSVLTLGLPILDRLGLPGTVFVPTAFAGHDQPMAWPGIDEWVGGPHERELLPLRWEELRSLHDSGWEIGSHTATHPRLPELDHAALGSELRGSKAACEERLGVPCRSIAYPYGDVDARVAEAAKKAGYECGAALPRRFHTPRPLEWPRVGVYHADTPLRFRLKASRLARRWRSSAAGERIIRHVRL